MPHQLYNLFVSKTFLFSIHASKHAISILLIKKKNSTNCFLSGAEEVDLEDKKINEDINNYSQNVFRKFTCIYIFLQIF